MKINVISESPLFPAKVGGMHTAFVNQVDLLKREHQKVSVNYPGRSDITHIHSLGPYAFYKLLTSKHTVLTSHMLPETFIGSYKGGDLLQGLIKRYLSFCYNKADMVFALTLPAEKELRDLGVKSRIEILPNPLNTKIFKQDTLLREQGRKEFKIDENSFVVAGVGHLIPRKGLEDFIMVARELPEITFIWAGGKIFSMLSAETKEQKKLLEDIPKNIRLLGHVPYEQMPKLYNAADALFFPSFQEVASMVVLEAAACGLPLVMRDLPEYKMFYKIGYIACKDNDDFIQTIKKLHSDKDFYKKNHLESIELASRFNSDAIGKKMIQYYHSLL